MMKPGTWFFALLLAALALAGAPQSTDARSEAGRLAPDSPGSGPYSLYLPMVHSVQPVSNPAGIHGRVTLRGQPVEGVYLVLRLWTFSSETTLGLPVRTDASGNYLFPNVGSLDSGDVYYVLYENNANGNALATDRLAWWASMDIFEYTAGERLWGGDFDIANIVLTGPADGATVNTPYTFTWQVRPHSLGDEYEFNLFDSADYVPWYYTVVGYVGSYGLTSLPAGFVRGKSYGWSVWSYNGDGVGESLYGYVVTFQPAVLAAGEPAPSLSRPILNRFVPELKRHGR